MFLLTYFVISLKLSKFLHVLHFTMNCKHTILYYTVEPRLLRRLGHPKSDAIFEVDAIFEGRTKTFWDFSAKCDICR